ncbi:Lsr2 family protein [Spongisporangium articulatum]|uniref:Lsr2 family protein n=1 Tax=Spongisporangium articulatum TaxID=3362603 RepID=A0ABW8AL07_9ACTN
MASNTTVELIDDVDGKAAAETVSFGLDGRDFEIDLSEKNAAALRKALDPWVAAGRKTSGRRTRKPVQVATGVDNRAVRIWAAGNGIELSSRGRIPAEVIDKYRAAGN